MANANWWIRHRFQALLIALLLLLVVYPTFHAIVGARPLFDALLTIVFLIGLWLIVSGRTERLVGFMLGAPTIVGLWTGYALPDAPRQVGAIVLHLAATLFLAFVVFTILRTILNEAVVSKDSIYGAFGGYLLVGLAFGHIYCFVETLTPGSYRGTGDFAARIQDEAWRHFELTYFSLTTLTSVGYGDILPTTQSARSLAVCEAILGQFYIAVLIAELIGKRVAQVLDKSDRNDAPD